MPYAHTIYYQSQCHGDVMQKLLSVSVSRRCYAQTFISLSVTEVLCPHFYQSQCHGDVMPYAHTIYYQSQCHGDVMPKLLSVAVSRRCYSIQFNSIFISAIMYHRICHMPTLLSVSVSQRCYALTISRSSVTEFFFGFFFGFLKVQYGFQSHLTSTFS